MTITGRSRESFNPDSRPGAFVAITVGDTGVGIPRTIRDNRIKTVQALDDQAGLMGPTSTCR